MTDKTKTKSPTLKEIIAGVISVGALMVAVVGIPSYVIFQEGLKEEQQRKEAYADIIGISDKTKDIKRILGPKDFDGDGHVDFMVDFKNNQTRIYLGPDFRRNINLTNCVLNGKYYLPKR